ELAPAMDAITRTTFTPTMLHGSEALNVVPDHAVARIDCRVLPGTDPDQILSELHEIFAAAARPEDVWEVESEGGDEGIGGTISTPDPAFPAACEQALERVDGRPLVMIPILNPFFTDAMHLRDAWGTTTYGMWPWKHTSPEDYQAGVHAPNERVKADDIAY